MKPGSVAIVGAAETTAHARIPQLSALGLAADAALNALADAQLKPSDIDGVATAYLSPADLAWYLGIRPAWIDGTSIGGCSWLCQVIHAAAAIEAGLCTAVLVAHGESGRSNVAPPSIGLPGPGSLCQQFDEPYGWTNAACLFGLPLVRYMRDFGVTEADLAQICVTQRMWAARNPRALYRDPLTAEEVLASRPIAWPLRKLMCCVLTDAGGALILTRADRARDFPNRPVYLLGSGEAVESYLTGASQVADPLRPEFVRQAGQRAFQAAGLKPSDVDHLMIYDAFAHNPLMGLEGLGFAEYGQAMEIVRAGRTVPGGDLPLNTNGGGLNYSHSGCYGMLLMQESVRQLRGTAPAQVPGVEVSLCHGWGGYFSVCATLLLSNAPP